MNRFQIRFVLKVKLLDPPPKKRRGSDKRSNLIICLIYRGWNNGTLEMYDVSEKINAIGLSRKKHSIVNSVCAFFY